MAVCVGSLVSECLGVLNIRVSERLGGFVGKGPWWELFMDILTE